MCAFDKMGLSRWILITLLVFITQQKTLSQGVGFDLEKAKEEFRLAATEHRAGIANLIQSRGMQPSIRELQSLETITSLMARYYGAAVGLLFYHFSGSRLSIWLISGRGIQAFEKVKVNQDDLNNQAKELRTVLGISARQADRAPTRRGVTPEQQITKSTRSLDELLQSLTDVLLPVSIRSQLKTLRYLVVVPAGNIGAIPLSILKPFGSGSYLIDSLSYAISPSLIDVGYSLLDHRGKSSQMRFTFDNPLVVGNPDFSHYEEWVLPPLPGAELEARTIAEMIGTTPFIGRDAQKKAVELKAQHADFLYFATHGVAQEDDAVNKSFLAMGGKDDLDGEWTAKEIQEKRLVADLAVLSACQTGLGQTHDAGIIGVARAFQLAGVKNVIMSLWSVDDDATASLMVSFVQEIQRPSEFFPSEALRRAMLKARSSYSSPLLWASFVVFGVPL